MTTSDLSRRRIALEIKESELIQTGRDLASLVITGIDSRKQAQLFLRRHKAVNKIRLYLTIDKVSDMAERIDRMVPDIPKRGLFQ